MHVLIIPSWYPTNPTDVSGCFFREQAQALARYGCKVGVIYPSLRSLKAPKNLIGPYGRQLENDNGVITMRYHGVSLMPGFQRGYVAQWSQIGESLFRHYVRLNGKPDIIHAQSMLYGGHLASRLARVADLPYVITEHSSAYARQLLSAFQLKMAKQSVRLASGLFSVSGALAALLSEAFPIGNKQWEVMPNFVNSSFLATPLKTDNSLGKKSIFKFCHISLLNSNKAVENLIFAFSRLSTMNQTAVLSIAGIGPEKVPLEELARTLGLDNRVEFLGQLSRSAVLTLLEQSDALVLTSRYETFGVVLIEAMALGKPVIATRCGGPESIVTEKDGFLVPINDIQKLAHAMELMMNNIHKFRPRDIRERCSEKYSEQVIVKRLVNKYESICNSRV